MRIFQLPVDKVVKPVSDVLDIADQLIQYTVEEIQGFDVFKVDNNKIYDSIFDEQTALLNFLFNQREIQQHNLQYELGLVTFVRSLWKFSDMLAADVNKYMNGFIRPVETREYKEDDIDFKPPKSLDYVAQGFVTPGKNLISKELSFLLKTHLFKVQNQVRRHLIGFFQVVVTIVYLRDSVVPVGHSHRSQQLKDKSLRKLVN